MIYEPDNTFDFNNLQLVRSTSNDNLLLDSVYIKFLVNDNQSLLIQSPKCITKYGIVEEGSKCDFVFTNKDESFLDWIESLEAFCHKNIFDKKHELLKDTDLKTILFQRDVEDSFRNTLKPFNAGRSYALHSSVSKECTIYDENENLIANNLIVGGHTLIIAILEFKGIRFSSHQFQMDICVKQIMTIGVLLPPSPPIVSKCLIKKNNLINLGNNIVVDEGIGGTHPKGINVNHEKVSIPPPVSVIPPPIGVVIPPVAIMPLPMADVFLEETNLNEMEVQETAHIKNRRELFLEIYRDAKQKAKLARNLALMAYLEKMQIKNNYMLEDIESDEDE
jgi:hypothetical protein